MKAYATLTDIKSASFLNLSGTGYDTGLRKLLEESSDVIDKEVRFSFHPREETHYFDGVAARLLLRFDPLLSVSTVKTDEDGDGTFENTLAATDYHLIPYNRFPKTALTINPNGNYSYFGGKGTLK